MSLGTQTESTANAIDVLRDAHGTFTMVAVDQRESLRHMYARGQGLETVGDEALRRFKSQVSRSLAGEASGILLDRDFGLEAATQSSSAVILAADILSSSRPGSPVDQAEIDDAVTEEVAARFNARALKLLVPWLPERRAEAIDLAERFMARCRELGLPGVLEGVVRPRDEGTWTSERLSEALVGAAEDFAAVRPDLYKTEVVYSGPHDYEIARETSLAITELMHGPWVVLSSGVTPSHFPDAVAAACAGGAEGFLAGRAIWAGALTSPDPDHYLKTDSRRHLRQLIASARGGAK